MKSEDSLYEYLYLRVWKLAQEITQLCAIWRQFLV